MKNDSSNNISENDRAFDFDFDAEFDKETRKRPDVKITVQSDDPNIDGLNSVDNPSYFFDFSILRKHCSFDIIKENQYIFEDDIQNFNDTYILKDNSKFLIAIPFTHYIHQPDNIRVYIRRVKDDFLIPVLLSENTRFDNLSEYNMTQQIANEICCTLSYHYKLIKEIMYEKSSFDEIDRVQNLLRWSDMFSDDDLTESMTVSTDITDLPRMIWVDCNRDVSHAARIKFQHNKSIKITTKWASVVVDANNDYPVENCRNTDMSEREINLIRRFVEVNAELLNKVFYKKYNGDISLFLSKIKRINKKGEVIEISKNENYLKQNKKYKLSRKIDDDLYIIQDKKTNLFTVLKNGYLLFENFYEEIEYNSKSNIFYCYIDIETFEMDTFDYTGELIK